MARVPKIDHTALEQQLKEVIHDLSNMMVQVSNYDTTGRPSKEVLSNGVKTLAQSLRNIHDSARSPTLPQIPPELVQYVENGRNPDIYTREFVEAVRRGNQLMRGKQNAFAQFRDVLAEQICEAMPELKDDVATVLRESGHGEGTVNGATHTESHQENGVGLGVNVNGVIKPS